MSETTDKFDAFIARLEKQLLWAKQVRNGLDDPLMAEMLEAMFSANGDANSNGHGHNMAVDLSSVPEVPPTATRLRDTRTQLEMLLDFLRARGRRYATTQEILENLPISRGSLGSLFNKNSEMFESTNVPGSGKLKQYRLTDE